VGLKESPRQTLLGSRIHAETADEGGLVALSVRDDGRRIVFQDLARRFERFYKRGASRSSAGVGLGLAIVKHPVRDPWRDSGGRKPPRRGCHL